MTDLLKIAGLAVGLRNCGPGTRIGLWVQGCSLGCAGCFSWRLRDARGGIPVDGRDLAKLIARLSPGHDGLTLTGGEPFEQAGALAPLVSYVRTHTELDILSYSGFTLEEILEGPEEMRVLLRNLDMLIDGRFVEELRLAHPWMGSSNQRLHMLTPRARRKYRRALEGAEGTNVMHVGLGDNRIHLIGVPGDDFMKRLREGLAGRGIRLADSTYERSGAAEGRDVPSGRSVACGPGEEKMRHP